MIIYICIEFYILFDSGISVNPDEGNRFRDNFFVKVSILSLCTFVDSIYFALVRTSVCGPDCFTSSNGIKRCNASNGS